jgi:hypothetical protein
LGEKDFGTDYQLIQPEFNEKKGDPVFGEFLFFSVISAISAKH